jgi:peptidoglycan hydrolase CwlO-like protein
MELVRHFEDAAKEVFASDKMSEEMQLSWQSLQVGVSDLESENIDLNVRVQDYEDYIEKLLGDLEERKQEIANLEQSFRESVDMLKILQKKVSTLYAQGPSSLGMMP